MLASNEAETSVQIRRHPKMRWTPGGSSDDAEDRRDDSGSGGMQFVGFHLVIGGLIIVFVLSLVFHRNFFALLGSGSGGAPVAVSQQHRAQESPATNAILFLQISRKEFFNTHAWFRQLC
jgi:predicted metalloprotease